jgi:hypothetical protein
MLSGIHPQLNCLKLLGDGFIPYLLETRESFSILHYVFHKHFKRANVE